MQPFSEFETPYFAQCDLHVLQIPLCALPVKSYHEHLQAKPAAEGEAKEGEAKPEGEGEAPAEGEAAPAEGEAAPAAEEAAPAEES